MLIHSDNSQLSVPAIIYFWSADELDFLKVLYSFLLVGYDLESSLPRSLAARPRALNLASHTFNNLWEVGRDRIVASLPTSKLSGPLLFHPFRPGELAHRLSSDQRSPPIRYHQGHQAWGNSRYFATPPIVSPRGSRWLRRRNVGCFLRLNLGILRVLKGGSAVQPNPLYRHPLNKDTSLSRTVWFVPGERKPLHFL